MEDCDHVCLTCFQKPGTQFLEVRSERNSATADVLRRHFWFTDVDFHKAIICRPCWYHVDGFNQFYVAVEERYQRKLASVIVKTDVEVGYDDYPEESVSVLAENKIELTIAQQDDPKVFEIVTESTEQIVISSDDVDSCEEVVVKKEEPNLLDVQKTELFDYETQGQHVNQDEAIREHVKYICALCNEESISFEEYVKHSTESHGNNSAFVECCGVRYYQQDQLYDHVQTMKNMFHCAPCVQNFNGEAAFNRHMEWFHPAGIPETLQSREEKSTHLMETSDGQAKKGNRMRTGRKITENLQRVNDAIREHVEIFCNHCGIPRTNFSALWRHTTNVHGTKTAYVKCCDRKYYSKAKLYNHVLVVNDPDRLRCKQCMVNFATEETFTKHMERFHPNLVTKPRRYKPRKPKKPMETSDGKTKKSRRRNVPRERKSREENEEEDNTIREHVEIFCNECGIPVSNFTVLKKHAMNVHGGKAYVACCGKKYYAKSKLLDHVIVLKDPDKYRCKQCMRKFTNKTGYMLHRESFHTIASQEKRCIPLTKSRRHHHMENELIKQHTKFICSLCGLDNQAFTPYLVHADKAHDIKHTFVECCGKKYYHKRKLYQHVVAVLKPTLFHCDKCDQKNFIDQKELDRHQQLVHDDLRPKVHKCEQCLRNFPNKHLYEKHLEDHLTRTKEKCDCCPRTFQFRKSLIKHLEQEHAEYSVKLKQLMANNS